MEGSFTKIVVGCETLGELLKLKDFADNDHIPYALILDEGRTEFKGECPNCGGSGYLGHIALDDWSSDDTCGLCKGTGQINVPTYTCLAIGPDTSEKIDPITGHLSLL
jgi:peptidyl-tRNA hydrolase